MKKTKSKAVKDAQKLIKKSKKDKAQVTNSFDTSDRELDKFMEELGELEKDMKVRLEKYGEMARKMCLIYGNPDSKISWLLGYFRRVQARGMLMNGILKDDEIDKQPVSPIQVFLHKYFIK